MSSVSNSVLNVPFLPFLPVHQKLLQTAAHLQASAFKAVLRTQIEGMSFLKRRYEADMKLMDDLADSSESNDAFDVLSNFMQVAASDYTSGASRLASIGSRLASETARLARDEARHAVEDRATATVA